MRGSLINPGLAEIHQLDTAASASSPGAGYNPVTREARKRAPISGEGPGGSGRVEKEPPVRIRAQVEVNTFEVQRSITSGQSPTGQVVLCLHVRDVERAGLVDEESGEPLLRVNDRLGALYDIRGRLIQAFRDSPGLYCSEVRPYGPGLGGRRNLLLMTFDPPDVGVRA